MDTGRDARGRFLKGAPRKAGPGRPPAEFSPTQLLRSKVAERPQIIERILALAESEDENVAIKALTYIVNRLDGMPKQAMEHTGPDEGPIKLTWSDGSEA